MDPVVRKTLSEPPANYPPLPDAMTYSSRTRAWYRTWATSPQAARFLATDWQRLAMLAPLVDLYFSDPKPTLFAEIRTNEAALGATEADRLRLRWDVAEAKSSAKPTPTHVGSDRQESVMRLIEGGKAG